MNEIKPYTNQLSKKKFVCDDDGYEQTQLCSLSLVVLTQCSKFVFDRYEQTIMFIITCCVETVLKRPLFFSGWK
jgi:hypothetical protein